MPRVSSMTVARTRDAVPTPRGEPLLGWRLWRAREQTLESWAVASTWDPGPNEARCLSPIWPCGSSPGPRCKCGFWGLFSPLRALERGRADRPEDASVLGLMRGWGEVAVHGPEGFRAQRAQLVCLFRDWVWDAPQMPCPAAGWGRAFWILERRLDLLPAPVAPHPARVRMLEEIASRYQVPLVSLEDAVHVNALTELGAGRAVVGEVRAWLEMVASDRASGVRSEHRTSGATLEGGGTDG